MKKYIFFLVTSIFAISVNAQETIRLNLELGRSYKIVNGLNMGTLMVFGGREIESEMYTDASYTYLVKEVTDSSYLIHVSIDSLNTQNKTGDRIVSLSSERGETEDPRGNMLAKMKERTYSLKIDKLGNVLSLEDNDTSSIANRQFNSRRKNSGELNNDPENRRSMRSSRGGVRSMGFGSSASVDSQKQLLAISFAYIPEKAVKKGDTWNKTINLQGSISGVLSCNFELKSIKKGIATISAKMILSEFPEGSEFLKEGSRSMKLTGEFFTEYSVDVKSAWITLTNTKMSLGGLNKMEDAKGGEGMEIEIFMEGQTISQGFF